MEDAPQIGKTNFQNRNVQTFGFVYHDTNGLNHCPVRKTQLFVLNEICTVILWQDYYGKGNLRRSYLKHGWEKIPHWECLFVHREKGLFLSVYVDDIKLAGKRQKRWSDVEITQQRSRFGRTNIFLWSCTSEMHLKTMLNKQRCCWQLQSHVWIKNFHGRTKNYHTRKIFVFLRGLKIWKGMPRNVWNDIVSWQTKTLNNSTKYLLHALMTITSKRTNWKL